MKLEIHPSLILWLSILCYLDSGVILPFAAAVILHEAGHWLMLQIMGCPPRHVVLGFSGAVMDAGAPSYRQELAAAAAGPCASLLAGLLLPLWPALAVYSVMLGLFNCLPIPGLDGWRVLRCGLMLCLPLGLAERIAAYIAVLTALALWGTALYATLALRLGLWPLALAALLLYKALNMQLSHG